MKTASFLVLACVALLQAPAVLAQSRKCPAADQIAQRHLIGAWRADIEGIAAGLRVVLKPHPQFAQTLRGTLQRYAQRVELAGDVVDGELTLEESINGTNITATWLGEVVPGSCGREIRGSWKAERMQGEHPFVLKKQ